MPAKGRGRTAPYRGRSGASWIWSTLPSTPARARGNSVRATPSLHPPRILKNNLSFLQKGGPRKESSQRTATALFFIPRVGIFQLSLREFHLSLITRQVPHLFPDLSSQSRLAVLGDEHKVISQPIHCMRTFPILRHLRSVPPSLLKASPKGEGVHPSQSGTLRHPWAGRAASLWLSRAASPSLVRSEIRSRLDLREQPEQGDHHLGPQVLLALEGVYRSFCNLRKVS